MKKLFTFALGVISGAVAMFGAREPERITSVEPPFWWTGRASATLQLMLSGPGIAAADFSLEYPGVNID